MFIVVNRAMATSFTVLGLARALYLIDLRPNLSICIPAFVMSFGILSGIIGHRAYHNYIRQVEGAVALCAVVLALWVVNLPEAYAQRWGGFGPEVSFLSFTCLLVLCLSMRPIQRVEHRFLHTRTINICSALIILLYLPSMIQTRFSLLNLGDSTYHVLDELLAPLTGKIPYFDYSPQYTSIYGWILWPLRFAGLSPGTTMIFVIVFCNILIAAVPLLMVQIVRGVLPSSRLLPICLAIVSIIFVSGKWNGATVLTSEFSSFGRIVPLLFIIRIFTSTRFDHLMVNRGQNLLIGLLSGLSFLNNPEMGTLFLISLLVAVVVPVVQRKVRIVEILIVAGSALGVVLLYLMLGLLVRHSLDVASFVGIRLGGHDLYPESNLDVLGPHLICVGLSIAGIFRGLQLQVTEQLSDKKHKIALLEIYSAMILCGFLVKYFLFPVGPGVLQLLLPSFLVAAFLFADFCQDGRSVRIANWKHLLFLGPSLLILTVPLGALTQMPYPPDEVRRIVKDHSGETNWSTTPGRPSDGWSIDSLNKSYDSLITKVEAISKNLGQPKGDTMYFGIFGNTVQLVTGVANGLGIAAPESIRFGGNQPRLACKPVDQHHPKFVIVYGSSFPCAGYQLTKMFSSTTFQVFARM